MNKALPASRSALLSLAAFEHFWREIGMDTKKIGGLGEILHPELPEFIAQYRFFFNPIQH